MKNTFQYLFIVLLVLTGNRCNLEKIADSLVPNASFTVDKTNCDAPCTITITNNSTDALSFAWNFGDNSSSTDENPAPHLYTAAGNYTIRLIASGPQNNKDTFSVQVAIVSAGVKPIAGFTITNNGCTAPCSISFTNTTTNGATYLWSFGDPISGTLNTNTDISTSHLFSQPGSYAVKMVATNGSQKDSITQNVTISGIKFEQTLAAFGPGAKARQLSDGGYIVGGSTSNTAYLVRFSATGIIVAQNEYPYNNSELINDIVQLSDGSFVAVGATFNSAQGNSDCFYLRAKSDLTPLTGPTRFGENNYEDVAQSITELTDGSVLIVGYSTSISTGNNDVYIARFSPDLTTNDFKKRLSAPDDEIGFDAVEVSGGYIIVGSKSVTGSADPGNALVLKIDELGDVTATKSIGTAGYETAVSVVKINNSELMLCGNTTGAGSDIWLQKISSSTADPIGAATILGTPGDDFAFEIATTGSNGFAIGGQNGLDAYLLVTDNLGVEVFDKIFTANGEEAFRSVQQTSDGGYILCGYKASALYLAKTDKDGKTN